MRAHALPVLVALASFAVALAAAPVRAEWVASPTNVPIDRLVANLEQRLAQDPDDAAAHQVLARIHSLAWARGGKEVPVELPPESDPQRLPGFAPWDTVRAPRPEAEVDAARLEHYRRSIVHYRRATTLDQRASLAWLGLGWMLEVGVSQAPRLGLPEGDPGALEVPAEERARHEALVLRLGADEPAAREEATALLQAALPRSFPALAARRASASAEIQARIDRIFALHFEDEALKAYRRAFALALAGDLAAESLCADGDAAVSAEAGRGIVRILAARDETEATRVERERVRDAVAKIDAKPKWITPVVFPLDGQVDLARLLVDRVVRFDLDGDGETEAWPWVGPRTGLLVWDPEETGLVATGRDLFGSVTWWLFWRGGGYEALAALDDDGDGALEGTELAGIAVWTDADGDAVSDPGEVVPARRSGVLSIAVHPTLVHDGVPAHPQGIRLQGGATRPTYDWTPRREVEAASGPEGSARPVARPQRAAPSRAP